MPKNWKLIAGIAIVFRYVKSGWYCGCLDELGRRISAGEKQRKELTEAREPY